MDKSQAIRELLAVLQQDTTAVPQLRMLLHRFSNQGFGIARSAYPATQKWDMLDDARDSLLLSLREMMQERRLPDPTPITTTPIGDPNGAR